MTRMYRIEAIIYDVEFDIEIQEVSVVPEFALKDYAFTSCLYVGDLAPEYFLKEIEKPESPKEKEKAESKVVEIQRAKKPKK
jgi:hypothetical protein